MSSPYSEPAPASGAPGGKTSFMTMDSNVAAMLCYILNFVCCLGLVLSIIFAITEKENRFVKFHAVQSLFLTGLQIVVGIVLGLLGLVLSMVLHMVEMEFLGWFMVLGLRFLVFFIFIVIWIIAGVKAYGGQWYKLPIIG